MPPTVDSPLTEREHQVLNTLVQMHQEFGLFTQFTGAAVAHIAGPCAGSLAALAMHGYATQRMEIRLLVYRVTEAGFALFAGIDPAAIDASRDA